MSSISIAPDVDVDIKGNQTNIAGVTVGDVNQQNFRH